MANVKVILRSRSRARRGGRGRRRRRHAHNFLIPQGKASLATEGNVREIEHQKRVVADRVAREMKQLGTQKVRLESLLLEVKANVGEEGKLFGSVTVAQLGELIAAKGIDLDRRKILLAEPIKEIGEHVVSVRLHKDVVANLKVRVIKSD
jgi:large subunit ribosomal protein L9